jgi:hypothetical protein
MPQEISDNAYEVMLDAIATGKFLGAHTGDPGVTGQTANEISGGAPAYARKAAVFNAAASAAMTLNGTVTLDIPAATVSFLSIWDHVTAGAVANFFGRVDIADEVFGSQGTLDITAFTLAMDQNPA